jgi:hypothetical protein
MFACVAVSVSTKPCAACEAPIKFWRSLRAIPSAFSDRSAIWMFGVHICT